MKLEREKKVKSHIYLVKARVHPGGGGGGRGGGGGSPGRAPPPRPSGVDNSDAKDVFVSAAPLQ